MSDPVTSALGAISGLASQAAGLAAALGAGAPPADELELIVGGRRISGWTRVRVTRGVERLPSEFDIEMTEYFPGATASVTVAPGAPCRIAIGGDLVLTGYVDRFMPSIEEGRHSIRVTGRGKCQDLVDCSAEWEGGQISGTSALDIASKLAAPYGIAAASTISPAGPAIPQFNLMYGETPAEVIERVTRYSGLLFYDGPDGNLVLSRVGSGRAASGFAQGVNVQYAAASFAMDQRFSEYVVALQSLQTFGDIGDAGNTVAVERDPQVPRRRRMVIVCESGSQGQDVARARAAWEAKRRFGRSFQLDLITDGWRDSAGALWQPNTLAPLDLPALRLNGVVWVIGEVSYIRDERGTTARLLLMPPDAFSVQPILIQPRPLAELPEAIHPPGGNQNPATPGLPPPPRSPAVSPSGEPRLLNPDGSFTKEGAAEFLSIFPSP